MKIIGKQPSREKCAESGWFAWDYLLDEPVEREFILKLRPLGGFTYLDMLKQPFFKIRLFSSDRLTRAVICGSPNASHQLASRSGVSAEEISGETAGMG